MTCPSCNTPMQHCPAMWDGMDADGRRGVLLPACWACDDCGVTVKDDRPDEPARYDD